MYVLPRRHLNLVGVGMRLENIGRKAVDGDKSMLVETQEYYDGEWQTISAAFKDYDVIAFRGTELTDFSDKGSSSVGNPLPSFSYDIILPVGFPPLCQYVFPIFQSQQKNYNNLQLQTV